MARQVEFEPVYFGSGLSMRDPSYEDLSIADQARQLGWVNGCPTVERLISERGAETMRDRYKEINFWYGYFVTESIGRNPALTNELITNARRVDKVGIFEQDSVPEFHQKLIAPMSSTPGFALGRVMVEAFNNDNSGNEENPKQKFQELMNRIEEEFGYIDNSANVSSLLTKLAEDVTVNFDVAPIVLLRHMLNLGVFKEEQDHFGFGTVLALLPKNAPTLFKVYSEMSNIGRRAEGLYYTKSSK